MPMKEWIGTWNDKRKAGITFHGLTIWQSQKAILLGYADEDALVILTPAEWKVFKALGSAFPKVCLYEELTRSSGIARTGIGDYITRARSKFSNADERDGKTSARKVLIKTIRGHGYQLIIE